MTQGNLAKWKKQEGESFGPGDVICEVETDKATVEFEAQDDAIIAKILVAEGTPDIAVGAPIMVRRRSSSYSCTSSSNSSGGGCRRDKGHGM